MRAVCWIPAIECLSYYGLDHWFDIFETNSDRLPTDVVLPGFVQSGATYDSAFSKADSRLGNENTLRDWVRQSKELVSDAIVWATVLPTIPSLTNELTALRDQWEDEMEDACIVNPTVQALVTKVFSEIRALGVEGVALDLTDVCPNSTSSRYPARKGRQRQLQNSCFCPYCVDALKREARWTEGSAPFRSADRNLARFVLQATASGATPIDVRDSWLEKLDAADLVDFSAARGFIENEDDEGRQDAQKLLRYLAARSKITAAAVKRLSEAASSAGLRSAVVLGSALYDMSQHTNLLTLTKLNCADEYWLTNLDQSHLTEDGPVLLKFLASRSSYYYNAMFAHIQHLGNARMSEDADERVNSVVKDISLLASRNEFTIGQCAQIEYFRGIAGFVGVPFGKAEFIDLVTKLAADGSLSERHKTDLLSRIEVGITRITSGEQQNQPSNPNPWG